MNAEYELTYVDIHKRDNTHYVITNKEGEYLGTLEYIRVGALMSWVLTEVDNRGVYFSASCLDDIRKTTKELNAKLNTKGDD